MCDGARSTPGAFAIQNPDFNTRSLRGNAVLRWEYRPGATLYLVWQQERSDDTLYGPTAEFALDRDSERLFRSPPQNILSIKVSYNVGP